MPESLLLGDGLHVRDEIVEVGLREGLIGPHWRLRGGVVLLRGRDRVGDPLGDVRRAQFAQVSARCIQGQLAALAGNRMAHRAFLRGENRGAFGRVSLRKGRSSADGENSNKNESEMSSGHWANS